MFAVMRRPRLQPKLMTISPIPPKLPPALVLGSLRIQPPVVLAPMAGITDVAFRQLVSEFGGGLLVGEMISADLLAKGNKNTRQMVRFFKGEIIRSVQLYTTNPTALRLAIGILKEEFGVHHIDLNFGCPVPKVTRKGGGAALPLHRTRFPELLETAVAAAGKIPVTIKIRLGLDDALPYFLPIARLAQASGIAGVTVHARTAVQFYSGAAQWDAIQRVVTALPQFPIIGNGDIWTAQHAAQMIQQTGCAGVGIGRAVLGRPFLFRDLTALFEGKILPSYPTFREVARMARRHLELMGSYYPPRVAVHRIRKHFKWYFQGFKEGQHWIPRLLRVEDMMELDRLLKQMTSSEPYPISEIWAPRGKSGRRPKIILPENYRQQLKAGQFVIEEVYGSGG